MKKEMLINVLQPEECRIAIVEDGVLEELYVERTSHESYTGNIYKGKIVNLEPAIQAAFVDFSVGRNGFLHVSDVEPQYYQQGGPADEVERPSRDRGPEREPSRDRGPAADHDRGRGWGRSADREPPSPRRSFGEDLIDPAPPSSGPSRSEDRYRERGRDQDRERPDLSIRGRKDRSEPARRFGEGLGFEDTSQRRPDAADLPDPFAEPVHPPDPKPAPAPFIRETSNAAPEPVEEWSQDSPKSDSRESTGFGRRERTTSPREEDLGWGLDRGGVRKFQESESAESRVGGSEPDEGLVDPDLPPSRTHRPRGTRPLDQTAESEDRGRGPHPASRGSEAWDHGRETGSETDPLATPSRDPRRGRGRGRTNPTPESEGFKNDEFGFRADDGSDFAEPQLGGDRTSDESPRPRSGRAAIRSRGGERSRSGDLDRPRSVPSSRPPAAGGTASDRPYGSYGGDSDLNVSAPASPTSDRPRARDAGRGRASDARVPHPREKERERPRPSSRAGEPGYIPRRDRERLRGDDSAFGSPPTYTPDDSAWPRADSEFADDSQFDSPMSEGARPDEGGESTASKLEGKSRRRRRRGRRRDRERPATEVGSTQVHDPLDDDFDELPPKTPSKGRPTRPAYRTSVPDEDAGDDLSDLDFHDDEIRRDMLDDEDDQGFSGRRPAVSDEPIDPELEQEIRREIEEIEVLEREMGLRGPAEARPRRGEDAPSRGGRSGAASGGRSRGLAKPPVQEIFRRGDEVLVQVIKESIGTKGPTLSTYISIPGRYLVLMPGLNRVGVSRKIVDESQRRKLREIMLELNPPKNLGFIVRTAGLERTKRELAKDLAYLLRLWKVILRRIKKTKAPAPIYQESDMIIRTIRDIFTSDIDTIWIDEPAAFERAQEFLRVVMPRYVNRIKLHEEKVPLFNKFGIEDEIAKIQRRHVPLPEGGSIVIDQTEALVAIDVNSGNFRVEDDAERTAYEMNLRAAKEIGRQLRLRDLGGVIVNDFIDMREERHRRGVERAIRDAVRRDRARTKILRMSAFGLIEMTRQRIRPSLKRSIYEDCSHCTGAGVVKTIESMSIDVMRLLGLASNRDDIRRIQITVNPSVATHLNNRKRKEIARIENDSQMSIHIGVKENSPAEFLQIECFDANSNEVRLTPLAVTHHHRRGH